MSRRSIIYDGISSKLIGLRSKSPPSLRTLPELPLFLNKAPGYALRVLEDTGERFEKFLTERNSFSIISIRTNMFTIVSCFTPAPSYAVDLSLAIEVSMFVNLYAWSSIVFVNLSIILSAFSLCELSSFLMLS